MAKVRAWIVVVMMWSSLGLSVEAVELRNVLTDYTIASWSQKDGLPAGSVNALAQDADGYLWVGTSAGLYRFDGMRFVQWEGTGGNEILEISVRALCVSRSGSLWVGYGGPGEVFRIRDGKVRRYDQTDGLPGAAVTALIEDQAGAMWMGNNAGLFTLVDDRWQKLSPNHGLPEGPVYSAHVDKYGNLFIGAQAGVFRRRPDGNAFESVETQPQVLHAAGEQLVNSQPRSIAEDYFGNVWESDQTSGFRRLGAAQLSTRVDQWGRGFRLLFDRVGNLWVGTIGQGLWRVRHPVSELPATVERATSLTGLLSDGVFSLIEDKEGNLWVGTTEGLNRLTARRVTQMTNVGLVVGLELTSQGDVWVGAVDELVRFSPDSDSPSARVPLHGARLLVMHADRDGTLWAATDHGALRLVKGSVSPAALPGTAGLQQIDCITSDGRGGVLLHDQQRGLLQWSRGRLTPFHVPAAVQGVPVGLLFTDRRGAIWVAYLDGRLIVIGRDGSHDLFSSKDGLTGGVPRQFYEDDNDDIWLAASDGLSKLVGGRFVTINRRNGLPLDDLTAVIADDAGALWVGTSAGIIRIRASDHVKAIEGRADRIQYSLYDRSDGLAGLPLAYNNNRRVIRTIDGRLWFVTSRGLTLIDPRALRDKPPAGPIRIEGVKVDDKKLVPTHQRELPARTSRLEINYATLNLTAPFGTRFRYRLEGFDTDWINADTRRQAFYTNLPPRNYRFRVAAGNSDGSWAEASTSWEFSIRPMFYETSWFYGAVTTMLALVVWGGWRLRIQQVRRQFSMLLGERARLSREVHDTLLQSLVGVALQFDAIASDATFASGAAREQLVRMRRQVEEHIREARQSIWDLRSRKLERCDLVTALREVGEHATAGSPTAFELLVQGEPRRCSRKLEEQLLRIGQEAVLNAVRHGQTSHIRMTLDYQQSRVTLVVADDGCGFDLVVVREKSDHYGLVSMKERAEDVGGRLEVVSSPNSGTRVIAVVPASCQV